MICIDQIPSSEKYCKSIFLVLFYLKKISPNPTKWLCLFLLCLSEEKLIPQLFWALKTFPDLGVFI